MCVAVQYCVCDCACKGIKKFDVAVIKFARNDSDKIIINELKVYVVDI